jgi:hypothetical protein
LPIPPTSGDYGPLANDDDAQLGGSLRTIPPTGRRSSASRAATVRRQVPGLMAGGLSDAQSDGGNRYYDILWKNGGDYTVVLRQQSADSGTPTRRVCELTP